MHSYILAILFFKLSRDIGSIIPWKRSCFPPSFIFFFKNTYFKSRERASFNITSWLPINTAPAIMYVWALKVSQERVFKCRNVFASSTPACLFSSLVSCSFTHKRLCGEVMLWPGPDGPALWLDCPVATVSPRLVSHFSRLTVDFSDGRGAVVEQRVFSSAKFHGPWSLD